MFDKDGYIAIRPIRPEHWKTVIPDMPAGLIVTSNSVPPGLFFAQNFLAPDICNQIVSESAAQLGGQNASSGDAADAPRMSVQRTLDAIDTQSLQFNVKDLVRHIFVNVVAPQFGKQIDNFESAEVLRYKEGGEYPVHADADTWSAEEQTWKRAVDRDLSIHLYLNEDYEGGEIDFPNFGLKLKPQRGLLIAFPSDGRYLHAARPVTAGLRYALVSWASVKGSQRVSSEPRPNATQV